MPSLANRVKQSSDASPRLEVKVYCSAREPHRITSANDVRYFSLERLLSAPRAHSSTAPADQDSHMTSSPPALLSPAESHNPSTMPTAASGAQIANSNGKRPHGALTNGAEEDEVESMPNAPRPSLPAKTHDASGYSWTKAEDEPGYAWTNKKAIDEMNRAWDGMVHKDAMVKGELLVRFARRATRDSILTVSFLQRVTETLSKLPRTSLPCLRA